MSRPSFLDAPYSHTSAQRTASHPLPSSRDHADPDRLVGYGLAFVAGALVALVVAGVLQL